MATEFFTDDFRDDGYNSALKSSFQGQLSSAYTNALSTTLETDAADWIGYLAHTVNNLSIDDALLVKDAVAAGNFSLSDLFGAAQSKTGAVDGSAITDPVPHLSVTIGEGLDAHVVTIDLTAILSGLDTETWTETDTTGGGKKATTVTTFHTREFYTDVDQPANYDSHWSDNNQPPTADPIVVNLTEDVAPAGTVDLLTDANAADADGGTLAIVAGSITYSYSVDGGAAVTPITAPDFIDITGTTATIDTSAASLEPNGSIDLKLGQTLTLTVSYDISDGQGGTTTNTLEVNIAGAADTYSDTLTSQLYTKGNSSAPGDTFTGSFNVADGFDYSGTVTITANGDFDRTNETLTISGDIGAVLEGTHSTGPNAEPANVTLTDDVAVTSVAFSDGSVTFSGTFGNNVADGSTAQLELDYSYSA